MSDNALEVQQVHFNIATYTFQLHALSREAFCTMCIPSYICKHDFCYVEHQVLLMKQLYQIY